MVCANHLSTALILVLFRIGCMWAPSIAVKCLWQGGLICIRPLTGWMGKIRAAKGRGSCQSIGCSGEVGPQRIHTKPNNCSRPRKGGMLCLFFHFNYFFNSIIGSPGKVKKVRQISRNFVIPRLFHFTFFNSIIQVPIAKVKKKKYFYRTVFYSMESTESMPV